MNQSGSLEKDRNPDHLGGCGDVPCSQHDIEEATNAASAVGPVAAVFTDHEAFLHAIHTNIVDKVEPVDSGLLDVLCEVDAFSSEDEQFIRKGETRREKARRFSSRLRLIKEEDFVRFLPELKKKYPHVVAEREFQLKDSPVSAKCLRHTMKKRISLKRLLDILFALHCCCQEEYDQLQVVQFYGEKEWNQVFQLLQKQSNNPQLCQSVKELLGKKKFDGLENFEAIALNGFICSCFTSYPTCSSSELPPLPPALPSDTPIVPLSHPALPLEQSTQPSDCLASFEDPPDQPPKIDNHHETDSDVLALPKEANKMTRYFADFLHHDEGSSAQYPSSASSKQHEDLHDGYDSGITSLSEAFLQPVLVNEMQFQTAEHKKKFREVLGQINDSLTAATYTRTELRFLEMIRDDSHTLSKPAKDESNGSVNTEKLQKLLAKAKTCLGKVEELNKHVFQTWQDVEDLKKCLGFECPANWSSLLMIRYHLLRNEVRECQHITERAKEVLEQIREICHHDPQ